MGMNRCENQMDEFSTLIALLQSIALEEAALAHILNAEGDKVQKAICMADSIEELLAINEATALTIERAAALENSLREKTIAVLDAIHNIRHRDKC